MMKKAADKSAVRWSSVIFAALFFFLASLSGSLWYMQKTDDFAKAYRNSGQEALIKELYGIKLDILTEEVLQPYFDSKKEKKNSDEFNPANTNFRFEAVIESRGKDNAKSTTTISTMIDGEKTWCREQIPVKVDTTVSGQRKPVTVNVDCALAESMDKDDLFKRGINLAANGLRYENNLWAMTVILGGLALLSCAIAIRGAVREASRSKGAQRMFSVLPPDLYICCVLPALVILYKLLLDVYKHHAVLVNHLRTGSGQYGFLLRPICLTVVFVLLLVLVILLVYSLRRGGVQCVFAFRRFQLVPFTRRSVFYLLVMQIIKAASVGLYLFATSIYPEEFDGYRRWVLVFLLLEKLVTLPVIYRMLRQLRTIMERTEQFVQGDLSGSAANEEDYATLRGHGADVDTLVQRIVESADEYIQSSNFKAELITNLSHDIKTPLTSIINYAQLLKREDLTPEDRVKYLHVLQRHSGRLQKLVDDLSEVSDAASGNVPVELTVLDLCALVQQAVSGFEERLLRQNITIRFRLPKSPVYVAADPRLLQRVTDNLMNNICKYTRFGTEVQIAVVDSKYRVAAVFRNLSDKPMKLSGEELMERFVREEDVGQKEGSGLGLSIAQSLMHLQGGKLWLHVQDDVFTSQILFRKL